MFGLEEMDGVLQDNFNIQATLGGSGAAIGEMIYDNGLNTTQTPSGTLAGQGLFADNPADLLVRPSFAGQAAGTDVDLVVTLTDQSGGGWSNTDTTTFSVVDNRVLTGSATIDAGRHMVGHMFGELIVGGGTGTAALQSHATDVTINANKQRTVGKTRLHSDGAFTFNDADQTYSFGISSASAGVVNTALTGNQFLSGSDFGTGPLAVTEAIDGSMIAASGVTLNVTGTALLDRQVFDATENLGRFMLNTTAPSGSVPATQTQKLTTFGNNNAYTAMTVGGQTVGTAGDDVVVTTTGGGLDASDAEVDLTVTTNFAIDTSSIGAVSKTVDVALTGEGLDGENAQATAKAGYNYNVVGRNQAIVPNVEVFVVKGRTGTLQNAQATLEHSTTTHTNIQLNDAGIDLTALAAESDFEASAPRQVGSVVTVQGEGLAGEGTYADEEYDVTLTVVEASNVQANIPANGNSFSVTNTQRVGGVSPKKQAIAQIAVNGTQVWTNPDGTEAGLVATMNGGDSYAEAGTSVTGSVQFIALEFPPGGPQARPTGFGEYYEERFYVYQKDVGTVEGGEPVVGGVDGSIGSFIATHGSRGTGDEGSVEWDLGYDFFGQRFVLTSDTAASIGAKKLELAFLDSEALASAGTVTANFRARGDLDAGLTDAGTQGFDQLAGDAVQITGLDGFQHVIQLNALSGQNSVAWYDTDNDAWINAVLGNSNITDLDLDAGTLVVDGLSQQIDDYLDEMRYEGTYFQYLGSLGGATDPQLGAFGVHADGSAVWAVIDHNSVFSVLIPEPGAAGLLGMVGLGLLGRGRSQRRRVA